MAANERYTAIVLDDTGIPRHFLGSETRFESIIDSPLALYRNKADTPWILLSNHAADDAHYLGRFSPNGRYFAWGDSSGGLYMVDLESLTSEIEAFEKTCGLKK